MTYHNNPNIGRCGAEMVEKGVGGEAAERRSVYSGTCTVRSAKNKTVCVTRLCGVNAFCQLKSRPAWRVSVRYCGHFSLVSLLILQSESGQEKKKMERQTHWIHVISGGQTIRVAKSNGPLASCSPFHSLLTDFRGDTKGLLCG